MTAFNDKEILQFCLYVWDELESQMNNIEIDYKPYFLQECVIEGHEIGPELYSSHGHEVLGH